MFWKKKINSTTDFNGGKNPAQDEIKMIWHTYGKMRNMVSLKRVNNMDDVIHHIDVVIPKIVAANMNSLTSREYENSIKSFLKFDILYGFLQQTTNDSALRQEITKFRKEIMRVSMLMIHSNNQQYPQAPIFYAKIKADAYFEKFRDSPFGCGIVDGLCYDITDITDDDYIKQGIAAIYYMVNKVITPRLGANNQEDYSDETWGKLIVATNDIESIRLKILEGKYSTILPEEWRELFFLISFFAYEDTNKKGGYVPKKDSVEYKAIMRSQTLLIKLQNG